MIDINSYLLSRNRSDYQRDNFDDFLKKIKFSYNVPSIHIAGTNGKGSVLNYLRSIYKAAGYKVGSFSTPDDFYQTIKINDQTIDSCFVEEVINEYEHLFDKYDLSSFEIQTFIAFKYFTEKQVDIAVIECGMGGEFDATNIFTPILSIITSVGIEHSDFLGLSFSEIALHKAGIIKRNVPCLISYKINSEALTVITDKCNKEKSQLTISGECFNFKLDGHDLIFDYRTYKNIRINSASTYEADAAALAIEAINLLKDTFAVDDNTLLKGLLEKPLKCRFEILKNDPLVLLDGAHNPEAILRLREEIDYVFPGKKFEIVFASFKDKNIALMLPELSLVGNIHLTTFNHPRARNGNEYFLYLDEYEFNDDYKSLLDNLISNKENLILVTGSLAFTYEVRKYLNDK